MPTASTNIEKCGSVSFGVLSNFGLQDIQVCLLPAALMYQHYLENTKLDIMLLEL